MRDSRWPRGTCTAPGMCDSSNSCCSRTSTITSPLRSPSRSWTSFGSTSRICSLALRMRSAAGRHCFRKDSGGPTTQPGRPLGRPGTQIPDPALPKTRARCPRKLSIESVAQSRSLPIWGLDPNSCDADLQMRHRDDSLIGQVVAANVVLVTLTLVSREPGLRARPHQGRAALAVPGPRRWCRAHLLREHLDAPAPLRPARAPDRPDRADRPRRAGHVRDRRRPGRGDRPARPAPSSGCSSAWTRSAGARASWCCARRRRSAAAWRATCTTR